MKKDFLSFTMKCLNWLLFCAALWALREIYPDCPFLIISSVLVYFSVLILMTFLYGGIPKNYKGYKRRMNSVKTVIIHWKSI